MVHSVILPYLFLADWCPSIAFSEVTTLGCNAVAGYSASMMVGLIFYFPHYSIAKRERASGKALKLTSSGASRHQSSVKIALLPFGLFADLQQGLCSFPSQVHSGQRLLQIAFRSIVVRAAIIETTPTG